jgi:hypothetical protein
VSKVWTGKHFSVQNGLKADVLLPLIFKAEVSIRKAQENQKEFELDRTCQMMVSVYTGHVNLPGEKMNTTKKNTKAAWERWEMRTKF